MTNYTNLQVYISRTDVTRIKEFILLNTKTLNLDLSNNNIVTIHHKAFWTSESNNKSSHTALYYLNLEKNNIKYIASGTFDPLINLINLELATNELSYIENKLIVNLYNLKYFIISFNHLTQLPTKWLPNNLTYLDIRDNAIEYLSSYVFDGAPGLRHVSLSIKGVTIDSNTFSKFDKLSVYVFPDTLLCTCKYRWYINTKSNISVCAYGYNFLRYRSVRQYLKEGCTRQTNGYYIGDIMPFVYIYI